MAKLPNDAPLQTVFDLVAAHLIQQGGPAYQLDANGLKQCMYQTPAGQHCAVGCLLDDEELSYKREQADVRSLASEFRILGINKEFWNRHDLLELLAELQLTHDFTLMEDDDSYAMDALISNLKETAALFDLTFKEPESATPA
jgi:hypothetical protein